MGPSCLAHLCHTPLPDVSPLCVQVKCIVLQVLRGLQYLHQNFIIHRWGLVLVRGSWVGQGLKGCLCLEG